MPKASPSAQSPWRNRIVGYADVDPRMLDPNPLNWRTHPHFQTDAMAGALEELGWVQNIVVAKASGHIIDGHLRVGLALKHGAPTVPVTYVDLNAEEERLALATIDPLTSLADANTEALAALLTDVHTGQADLQRMLEGLAVEYKVIPPEPSDGFGRQGRTTAAGTDDFDTTEQPAAGSTIHLVQLFLEEADYPAFKRAVDAIAPQYGTETLTDTVYACVMAHARTAINPAE